MFLTKTSLYTVVLTWFLELLVLNIVFAVNEAAGSLLESDIEQCLESSSQEIPSYKDGSKNTVTTLMDQK